MKYFAETLQFNRYKLLPIIIKPAFYKRAFILTTLMAMTGIISLSLKMNIVHKKYKHNNSYHYKLYHVQ